MVAEEKTPLDGDRGPASDDVILARTRLYYTITIVMGIPVACIGLGLLALMGVPLAHVIAGKHTDFSLTVSISFNAILTATTTLAGTGFAIQTSRARYHKSRARELETRVKRQEES